jgi:hypothetical protein
VDSGEQTAIVAFFSCHPFWGASEVQKHSWLSFISFGCQPLGGATNGRLRPAALQNARAAARSLRETFWNTVWVGLHCFKGPQSTQDGVLKLDNVYQNLSHKYQHLRIHNRGFKALQTQSFTHYESTDSTIS